MEKENNTVKIVEVCSVAPLSLLHSSNFSLSLSAFDWIFMKFPPIQRLFFYQLSNSDSLFFNSILIPNLKHSLSSTLQHFLPLAGNLLWPEDSPLPFLLYAPNDTVSFTVANTNSDFHRLSGDHPSKVKDFQALVPKIQPSSDTSIPLLAIQVTNFPNDGFSIGLAFHHVIFYGKSFSLFFKSWAHICNKLNQTNWENQLQSFPLPPELTPSFERASHVLQNPFDFAPKNRRINHESFLMAPSNLFQAFQATFELTPTHIQQLKKRVLESKEINTNNSSSSSSSSSSSQEEFHLSTFVVAYAYVLMCLMRAKQGECKEKVYLALAANARGLLDPPISTNYFGNCVVNPSVLVESREFREEKNFPKIAKKISDMILELRRTRTIKLPKISDLEEIQDSNFTSGIEICVVVASPKYKLYEADFGWGKPKKIEIVLSGINRISLTDARDGGDGVEVGLVLPNHQMDAFASLFVEGVN